jgi:membrane fusion protein (multidrug efflux system)
MVTLQALDPIWVDFPMPEQNIGKLQRDQVVELTVNAFPGKLFKGKVTSLDARVSQDTRTLLIRGTLDNPEKRLLPGMFANVSVLAGGASQVISVPRTAITFSLYGDSVYVVQPLEGSAAVPEQPPADAVFSVERRFVKTGQVHEDRIAIESGLKPGEQVVTTGQIKLNNGSRVKIDNSQELKLPPERPMQ